LFDLQGNSQSALDVAQQALEETAGITNTGNDADYNEALRLQDVIRQNIVEWTRPVQP
jgi:hypothetical protein